MPEETQEQPSTEEAQDEQAQAAPAQPSGAPEAPAEAPAEADQAQPAPAGEEADEAKADNLPECAFEAEDVGTLRKKVTVTVPRERITAKQDEMFGELMQNAQVPGFRIGRAPRRLIEKRFGREVSHDVRNVLVGESLGQVEDKVGLKTIGEPELDLDKIELPDSGPLVYSFEIEVAPEFDLPNLEGIRVEESTVLIDDRRIDETLQNWQVREAHHEATDEPAEEGDLVAAGVSISGEGIEALHRDGQVLRVAPGQIEGLPLVELGDALGGRKAGETATLTATVPQAHPNESWRGKTLTVEVTVNEVRRRVLPELDDAFAQSYGAETLGGLREIVGRTLQRNADEEARHLMREQVREYLLEHTELDVPAGAAQRSAERLLRRRYVDLLLRGMPRERIDERLTELQAAAGEEARQLLKLEFILQKIGEDKEIEATEEEVNARVAEMAQAYRRRPERLRQELEADGTLASVQAAIRDEKTLDLLVAQADVVQPEEDHAEEQKGETGKKRTKRPAKSGKEESAAARGNAEPADEGAGGRRAARAKRKPAGKRAAKKPPKGESKDRKK